MASKYRCVAKFTGVYEYRGEECGRKKGKPDLCYYIRYQDQYRKKVWEKIGWKSEGYSAQFAANVRNERVQAARHGQMPEVQKGICFGHVWAKYDKWLDTGRAHPQDDRQRYERHLKEVLEHMPLHQISPDMLTGLMRDLQDKGLAPATVKHCLVIVRQVINKARKWRMFKGDNPVSAIKLPSPRNRRERFLTRQEAADLIREIISPQTRNMAIISLATGMRAGEVCAMRWSDINMEAGIISVRGKGSGGNHSRHAYITDAVRGALKEQPDTVSGYVFESRDGGRMRGISNGFDRAVNRLKLNKPGMGARDKVTFHTLRHTFASWLAIEGIPLYTIKELMGHKTMAMTERYAHLCPDHKRTAAQAIGSLWSPSGTCPESAQCSPGDKG